MTEYICIIICVAIIAICYLSISCILCLTWVCCEYKNYFISEIGKKNKFKRHKKITWFKNVNEDSTRQESSEED